MNINTSNLTEGSLAIANEVIEKIAYLASLEVDGVSSVSLGSSGIRPLLNKIAPKNPVQVVVKEGVAKITVHITVRNGTRIMELSEQVQNNVKNSIQNMTQISVARVDVVIVGINNEKDNKDGAEKQQETT